MVKNSIVQLGRCNAVGMREGTEERSTMLGFCSTAGKGSPYLRRMHPALINL